MHDAHGQRGLLLHAQVAASRGKPTSQRVSRSRLSKAKLRKGTSLLRVTADGVD